MDANHTGFHRKKRDFGHTVEFDRMTGSHDLPNRSGFDLVGPLIGDFPCLFTDLHLHRRRR